MAVVKLLTYDVYRQGMTLFKDLADQTYQDIEHLPFYNLRKVADAEVPTGYDAAYRLLKYVKDVRDPVIMGDTIGIMGSKGGGVIQAYVVGDTPLASDWLSDVPDGPPLIPTKAFLYLVLSPGNEENCFYRYDEDNSTYVLVSSSDIIFAYTVDGATPLEDDWLSRTDGGDPLEPEENKFYVVLSTGDYENFIFRFDATLDSYIMLSGGGSGNGAIYTYVVGNVPYATGWLSDEVGGDPIAPKEGPLYLVLTPGPYFSGLYRYSETSSTYILVGNARVRDLTKAEYLNLSQAEQNDGTIYFITDSASSAPTADDYVPARVTAPSNPSAGTVILWKGAVTGDFDLSPAFYEFDGTHWQRTNLGIEGQTIQVDSMPTATSTLEGCVFQYIGTTTGNYQHGYFYECIGSGGAYSWVNLKVQEGETTQFTAMPAASAELVGKVYQFTGTTTSSFTHGYFYECVNNGGTYSWVNRAVQSGETIQFNSLPVASQELVGKVYQYTGTTTSSYKHNYFYECVDHLGTYSWDQCSVQDGETIQFMTMPSPVVDLVGKIYQFIGTTTSSYTHGYFYECVDQGSGNYVWVNRNVQDGETIQFTTLPTASQALVGKVYQFTGTTDASFTHNYFYECVDDSGVYSWKQCQVQDGDTIQFTTMPSPSVDWVDLIIQFVGTSTNTYQKGHFYSCKSDGGNYVWKEIRVETEETVEMSLEDFDALTPAQQNNGQSYFIPDAQPESNFVARTGFTPIGTIISVMGNTAPKHYLACDGTVYQISHYPELALYFKQQFGSENYFGGDGTDTFAVPDLRGEFLRGTGTNSHTDQGNGANVGTHQDGTLEVDICWSHNRPYTGIPVSGVNAIPYNTDFNKVSGGGIMLPVDSGKTATGSGYNSHHTSRPTNTSVLYCIAVRNIYIDAGYDYSETESVIGTWIDGKPVYQKTMQTSVSDKTTIPIANISTLNILNWSGVFVQSSSNNTFKLNTTTDAWVYVERSFNGFYFQSTSQWTGEVYITLQYTKTTD